VGRRRSFLFVALLVGSDALAHAARWGQKTWDEMFVPQRDVVEAP
jgi:hypothetical protein